MLPVPINSSAHNVLGRANSANGYNVTRRVPSPMVGGRGPPSATATDMYVVNALPSDNRRLYHHRTSKSLTTNHLPAQTRRFPAETQVHDAEPLYQDWNQGRSYRDTTSEIISLYAHQSTCYGGPPSLYEDSGRSRSFSTSSSRHTPSQNSSGALSGRSISGLHHSPAVCHGHLNRSGGRPESPMVMPNDHARYPRVAKNDMSVRVS